MILTRRTLLSGLAAAPLLSGCDSLVQGEAANRLIGGAEDVHRVLQRSVSDRMALAREFRDDQMSPVFRMNGTRNPNTPEYATHVANNFADWRLRVDGLVRQPLSISLAQLKAMPFRTQITRHDCVEGWSAIGKWHGPPLNLLLNEAKLLPTARFLVFHCADLYGGRPYYESVDLVDAFHPQTILAWGMNNRTLPVGHGAPIRLRVERQLGYKHAKYVMRIEAVDDLARIHGGKGGLWEDLAGYEWYAGI